jgi:hypothetical protein
VMDLAGMAENERQVPHLLQKINQPILEGPKKAGSRIDGDDEMIINGVFGLYFSFRGRVECCRVKAFDPVKIDSQRRAVL